MVLFQGFRNPELRTPKLFFSQYLLYSLPPLRVGTLNKTDIVSFFKKKIINQSAWGARRG